ncbi:MAG: hypothetical protein JKY85_08940 [Porticoccus sp.]|nr:hypothetical protein [Porticoccus sp.]
MTQENRVTIERPKMFIKAFKAGKIKISRPKWNEIADKAYQVRSGGW